MTAEAHSTTLYTLGRGILHIAEWDEDTPPTDPSDYHDMGNVPRLDVEVTEETLEHPNYRSGIKNIDKEITLESGYTVTFDTEEFSLRNLTAYLRATSSGARLMAGMALSKEYALKFVSNNAAGPNQTWKFWKVKLTPAGALGLISDEWNKMAFTGKGLSDSPNHSDSHFFDVVYVTTTTTAAPTTTTT